MKYEEQFNRFCLESKHGYQSLQYDTLKSFIQRSSGNDSEGEFVQILIDELGRTKQFISVKIKELRITLQRLQNQEDDLQQKCQSSKSKRENGFSPIQRLTELTDNFVEELKELAKFTLLNGEGFRMIVEQHDKLTGVVSNWYFAQNHEQFFGRAFNELEAFLFHVSAVYGTIRSVQAECEGSKGSDSEENGESDVFERKSVKYWVKAEDTFAVKAALIKHLPVYVFKDKKRTKFPAKQKISPDENLLESTPPSTTWVSSVYLDNPSLACYHRRVKLEEGAFLIRLRWYNLPHGKNSPRIDGPPGAEVFVERKTHHESWVWESSIKERFLLAEDDVKGYMLGESKSIPREAKKALASDIQGQITKENLQPLVRTVYKRTAFQLPDNNDVRITIDVDLTMIDEGDRLRCESEWKRNEEGIIKNQDYRLFPYTILEVKLRIPPPEWLDALVESPFIRPVPKFSKFQHSAASFFPLKVKEFPYWYNDDVIQKNNRVYNKVISDRGKNDYLFQDEDSAYVTAGDHSSGTLNYAGSSRESITMTIESGKIPDIQEEQKSLRYRNFILPKFSKTHHKTNPDNQKEQPKAMKRLKVEPKTYFANERTFIQWLTSSLLLVTLSGALVSLGDRDARVVGLLFMPLAILILIYAAVMFYLRLYRIRHHSKSGYHDVIGPAVLTVFLCVAMLSTFSLHFRKYSSLFKEEDIPEIPLPKSNLHFGLHESHRCHRLNISLPPFFEPSDALLDHSGLYLWTCSGNVLAKIHLQSEKVEEYIQISEKERYDIEGLTFGSSAAPDVIYIATEYPTNQALLYNLQDQTVVDAIELNQFLGEKPVFEGITYSEMSWYGNPQKDNTSGTFFGSSTDFIQVFFLKSETSSGKPVPVPLQAIEVETKIGSLTVFNNSLFALLDNLRVLRSWDLATSEMREYKLPTASKQWEGIAFDNTVLNSSSPPGEVITYLVMDSPPQIWQLLFSREKGFLEC
ncbi:vacuolar transporter chaperone 4-like [Lingula anatina]|uniref:Vacuolar transporter chaperone 4-like n=1 Tax=Lingula anatina TaxID=7574 RepID=A0A1S3JTV5_LINAN|nr:vacuolar transporter chaperone 4-like [Lingula anatina]|eukprot:XP_013413499.1 vacuolar transporter chaperone 4-like [Lingula anatina]